MHEIADSGFLIFMLAFVVIGLPVILGMGSEMLKTWTRHREAMAGALNAQAAEKAAQYAAHSERLEQRVRVLERIVTDRGADLAASIEDPAERSSAPELARTRTMVITFFAVLALFTAVGVYATERVDRPRRATMRAAARAAE